MAKTQNKNFDLFSILSSILLIFYLSIGFIQNWKAVDKIAPQWLIMSLLNLFCFTIYLYRYKKIRSILTTYIKSFLSVFFIGFIIWGLGSYLYAINPTEVLVNFSRQFNVLLMFISMGILMHFIKQRIKFLTWVITIILSFEIYYVLLEAMEMLNTTGGINSGLLRGVTSNRNITAFSISIKIPFILYLINISSKTWIKFYSFLILSLSLICVSIIQSRASFIAVLLIFIGILFFHFYDYYKHKEIRRLLNLGYLLIPILLVIIINNTFLNNKVDNLIERASTISLSTKDGSVNQRLRYYEDVLSHMSLNPLLGVGLGNWKIKSIEYDKENIRGYVVPYHAHSDFIQLGAELGIIGFLLYLFIFIFAFYYILKLLRFSKLILQEKTFIFFLFIALGVYMIDANLNFPIARPQMLVVWSLIIAILNYYYSREKYLEDVSNNKLIGNLTLTLFLIMLLPTIFINNQVFKSLRGQMFLLSDFNNNTYNLPINKVDKIVPDIPNLTVTTIPINDVKARYYVNSKKYDKALILLNKKTSNPYLHYGDILKSQIYQERGNLDSAKVYARKAFFGLPNNDLHSSRYLNLINLTKDKNALEEAFELLTYQNKRSNWKNYLIISNNLNSTNDQNLIERAKDAVEIFNNDQEFKNLYTQILVGTDAFQKSLSFSKSGLEFFNKGDHFNASKQFEMAIEANPYDYANFENAATSNYLNGNLDKAIEQIDVVINDLNPLNGKCEYIKALIYIKMGDPIGACPLLETSRDSGFSQAEATFDQYCK